MDGYPFGAKHTFTFRVNWFTDIEHYANMDETYVEPEVEEYKPREDLNAWLADPQSRDQFLTYREDLTQISWHGKLSQREVALEKHNFTDLYHVWLPNGTFIATVHNQGIRLWGGDSWDHQQRFEHPLVNLVDFSPCENYLVTWSQGPIRIPDRVQQGPQYFSPEDEGNNIAVWDVKTGHLLRTFPSVHTEGEGSTVNKAQMSWPTPKWSPDDGFVRRVTPGQQISVYKLPSMGLHGKKSIKIEGIVEFEWRPLGDKDFEDANKNFEAAAKTLRKLERMCLHIGRQRSPSGPLV